jgi:hypothetical protein
VPSGLPGETGEVCNSGSHTRRGVVARRVTRTGAGSGDARPCLPAPRTAPGSFQALGIPLLQGRELTWSDLEGKADGVVVTKALADRLWPGEDALGKGIRGNGHGYRVIGVTGELRGHGLDKPPSEAVFFPLSVLASYGPARRAARVDPAEVLRSE